MRNTCVFFCDLTYRNGIRIYFVGDDRRSYDIAFFCDGTCRYGISTSFVTIGVGTTYPCSLYRNDVTTRPLKELTSPVMNRVTVEMRRSMIKNVTRSTSGLQQVECRPASWVVGNVCVV